MIWLLKVNAQLSIINNVNSQPIVHLNHVLTSLTNQIAILTSTINTIIIKTVSIQSMILPVKH